MRFEGLLVFQLLLIWIAMADQSEAQQTTNYDESKVPKYQLPDPLKMINGKMVDSIEGWQQQRRSEILRLFETQVYGKQPAFDYKVESNIRIIEKSALHEHSIDICEHELTIRANGRSLLVRVLVFLPSEFKKPVPVFLGYNFSGNHSICDHPGIKLASGWVNNNKSLGITNNRANEKTRGKSKSRWPVEQIIRRGYGLATVYYGDVDPDFDDGFENGIHPLAEKPGSTQRSGSIPQSEKWGSIAAWAWGLSRIVDHFETVERIDHRRIAVMGHSRLGKTALWAGATDPRFAMVISNNSGCGGAALNRRAFGETVERINTNFPHWFCDNFNQYNNRESALPIDQHMLIALIAPRPVYIASATGDRWADPKGEFLSGIHAAPVYRLFGKQGIGTEEMPSPNQSIGQSIGYHIRKGGHDIKLFDWQQFLDFADRHLKSESGKRNR